MKKLYHSVTACELKNIKNIIEKKTESFDKKHFEWALRYGLFESIQVIIDISCFICSKYNLGNPQTYGECIKLLEKFKYINNNLSKNLIGMIGLRNLLVHEYAEIERDKRIEFLNYLSYFEKFVISIKQYL